MPARKTFAFGKHGSVGRGGAGGQLTEHETEAGRAGRHAFTLVEMLIVLGIIIVLLGILIPVITRSRYHARMVKCESNLRQIAQGVLQYAFDHKGHYPPRYLAGDGKAALIYSSAAPWTDQRVLLKGYVDFNAMGCPFAPRPLDYTNHQFNALSTATHSIEWTYSLWHGFQYPPHPTNPRSGIKASEEGQPFTLAGKSYSVLASDNQWDWTAPGGDPGYNFKSEGEHPTTGMDAKYFDNDLLFLTRWNNTPAKLRGPVDLNYAFNDGSVSTITKIALNYWDPTDPNYRTDVVALPVFAINSASWVMAMPAKH